MSSHDNARLASAAFDEVALEQVADLPMPRIGTGDGLKATYHDWTTGVTISRVDPTIDFDWGLGSPTSDLGATNFSASWEGVLEPQFDEPYTLHLLSDDGSRLWLNGQKIIDAWYDHSVVEAAARINFQAGHHYLVRVEYYQRSGEAAVKLHWSSPSTPKQAIPQAQLYSPEDPRYSQLIQEVSVLAQPSQPDEGSTSGAADSSNFDTSSCPPGVTNCVTVSDVVGAAFVASLGHWSAEGTAAYAQDGRGYVDYMVGAPADDMYRIEIEGGGRNIRGADFAFPLRLLIDGESLGGCILNARADQASSTIRQLTPWLKAGSHVIRVFWDNAAKYAPALQIAAVRLQRLDGADANGNGVKDWVEAMLHAQCGVEVAPMSSQVSPVCLEGRGSFLSMMSISGGTQPQPGLGEHWYANVPLSAFGPTSVTVSFQNDGLRETRQIQWQITDLLQADDLKLREGDALLLTVGKAIGQAVITVVGATNYTLGSGQGIVHRFAKAGTYTVTGSGTAPDGSHNSRGITVSVLELSLGDSPAAWVHKSRLWNCPDLPSGAVLESDPRLQLIHLQNDSATGLSHGLKTDAQEVRHLVARLGTNSSVVANLRVDGFRLFAASETYVDAIHTFSDGSTMIESGLVLSPVLPEVSVRLEIVVGGVTFDDGTLVKELTVADFNELGQASVRFLRPADIQTSVCHIVKAYQNGILVGTY